MALEKCRSLSISWNIKKIFSSVLTFSWCIPDKGCKFSPLQLGQLKKKLESMVKLNKTLSNERKQLLDKIKSQVSCFYVCIQTLHSMKYNFTLQISITFYLYNIISKEQRLQEGYLVLTQEIEVTI
jgi:hypothetical protein